MHFKKHFSSLPDSSMSDTSTSVTSAEGKVDASVSVSGVSLPVWVVATAGSTLFSFSSGFSLTSSDLGVFPGSSILVLSSSLVSCCSDSGTNQSF